MVHIFMAMNHDQIAAAFAEHGTWITRFVINKVAYGGSFDAVNDPRLAEFRRAIPRAKNILELGSLEGGHTIGLARCAGVKRVVGIEGRVKNLVRAQLAVRLTNAKNIEFVQADLETTKLKELGKFDAVYCCGLLYHLPDPWRLLRQFPKVSANLFLWTHYCLDEQADTMRGDFRGKTQTEGGADEPLSGLSPNSFWPTLGSLLGMLTRAGYKTVHVLNNDITHPDGPAVTLAAFKREPPRSRWWQR